MDTKLLTHLVKKIHTEMAGSTNSQDDKINIQSTIV